MRFDPAGGGAAEGRGLTDYSQVDILGPWYKSVNFVVYNAGRGTAEGCQPLAERSRHLRPRNRGALFGSNLISHKVFLEIFLQKNIPTKICQRILYMSKSEG